jgi:hypothetical protein
MNNRIADDTDIDEIMEYINDCNCLRNRIKQRIERLINTPLTEGVMFCLCIYQFMIIALTYIFILRMNVIEYCLWIFTKIVGDQIIELIAQTIKIIMMLHLFEELRLFAKALLCKCDMDY